MSPLMNSDKKRTIMDLSWQKGFLVNGVVARSTYLQNDFTLHNLSVDHITQALCELGPDALLYKVDISRAFCYIRIDPLGIKHYACFIDGSLPFGFRHGLEFFQHCFDTIRFIVWQYGFYHLYNYIDDLIYFGLLQDIY